MSVEIRKSDEVYGKLLEKIIPENVEALHMKERSFFKEISRVLKSGETDKVKAEEIVANNLKTLDVKSVTPSYAALLYTTLKFTFDYIFDNIENSVKLHRTTRNASANIVKIKHNVSSPAAKSALKKLEDIIKKLDPNEFKNSMQEIIASIKANKVYKIVPPVPPAPPVQSQKTNNSQHLTLHDEINKKRNNLKKTVTNENKNISSSNSLLEQIRKGTNLKHVATDKHTNIRNGEVKDWGDMARKMMGKIKFKEDNNNSKGPTDDSEWDD